ncbi:hypothetical protein TNCV_2026821 [Trichonephila clavipes]|nr:hypothetical protein TNCV_2026821 [Trichonephila clavipes]
MAKMQQNVIEEKHSRMCNSLGSTSTHRSTEMAPEYALVDIRLDRYRNEGDAFLQRIFTIGTQSVVGYADYGIRLEGCDSYACCASRANCLNADYYCRFLRRHLRPAILHKLSRLLQNHLHIVLHDSSGTVPPRVTDSRTALSAVQGDVVELPCAAQGFPVPRYSKKPRKNIKETTIVIKTHIVAAIAEWSRYRIVTGLVTSSRPVPLKTHRVGQRCTLNLSRALTSTRWCGVVVRRGGASSSVVPVT